MLHRLINQTNAYTLPLLAGLLYCSWPLGYILNPLVAEHGLASELAGAGQPYNWLFVWGDVVSGLIVLVAVAMFWWIYGRRLGVGTYGSLVALGLFGVGIIVAAISQVPCIAALHSCPNFIHNPITITHGVSSVGSCVFLWLSFVGIWHYRSQDRWLNALIVFYVIFGSVAFFSLFAPTKAVFIQNGFITFCALCVLIYPWFLQRSLQAKS